MSGHSTYQPQNAFMQWMERRLPIGGLVYSSFIVYPTPRNLNYWWTFGGILAFMLGVQIVTGVVLAMHYTPHVDFAFNSVEQIMRDVNYGWLLRYLHANGASMFFLAAYIHMFRGMYYGSYKEPREVLWILGVIILLLMIMTGFMGYVLPWGQMSFWAATVITNLFSAIPLVGESIVTWLWGGYAVGNPTLNRFYSLHYLLPFVIVGVVVLHIWALHVAGQNNPDGIEPKTEHDTVAFTPYATIKDGFLLAVFCILFAWFVFYIPNFLGHPDNYIPANPAVTPTHIVPEWYYLPFYAILRAIPNKLLGVMALGASILILAFLPWLDTSKVRSARYRPLYRQFFWAFVIVCIGLGWLGSKPPEGNYVLFARIFTIYYFAYFLVILPVLGKIERTKPLPNSIAESVLQKGKPIGAPAPPPGQGLRHAMAIARTILALAVSLSALAAPALAQEHDAPAPPMNRWSFAGPFGKFDRGQLQRGLKVYREVCQVCHGLTLVAFRTLADPGGPGFTPAQAAAIAAEYQVPGAPDDQGEVKPRPGQPADHFPAAVPQRSGGARALQRGPTRPVGDRQGARLRARLPALGGRLFHPVPGAGRRLPHRADAGLPRHPAGGHHAPARQLLQRVFPWPRHRHAAAAVGQARRIHRRRADDGRAICQGHLRLPDVDRRAAPRGAQAPRPAGGDLPHRASGAALLHQEEGVARGGTAPGEAHAAPADGISARVTLAAPPG